MIKLPNVQIPLELIAKSDEVMITEVRPLKAFNDGKVTDKIIGYCYTVVCP